MPSRSRHSFVEIGEELAKEKGISNGEMVKVRSNRGEIEAPAWSPSAFARSGRQRQEGAYGRHPDPLGLLGRGARRLLANTLTPYVGDANSQTPEFKAFLVNIEKA